MKMNKYRLSLLLLILFQTVFGYGQIGKYLYKEHREHNSKLVDQGVNYTIEKLKNGKYIFKKYHPELRVITNFVTFKSKKFEVKDVLYLEKYDDGEIVAKGEYVNNQKQGDWKEYGSEGKYVNDKKHGKWKEFKRVGNYEKGKKIGEWIGYDSKDRIVSRTNFDGGEPHGNNIYYDSLGQITSESIYEKGILISTTRDTISLGIERMPRFPGCEDFEGTEKKKKRCADKKMLSHIYQNIRYPKKARRQEIEGVAIVRFHIDKDGTVQDVKVLRGLSNAISEECLDVITKMPRWTPGLQRGQPVKVQFNLPITFKLK